MTILGLMEVPTFLEGCYRIVNQRKVVAASRESKASRRNANRTL
jgi:hypothetical protein